MRRSTLLAATGLAVIGLTVPALAPALAKPPARPKPIHQTVPFRDATPDPTGMAVGEDGHCSGLLPREAPYAFKAPARGTLKVSVSGFQGEWALHVMDEKGTVLAETDDPSATTEQVTVKTRKAGVVNILPCNLAGTFDSVITLVFTYA